MSVSLIVLLPFLGAVLPLLFIRIGRNACALATGAITLTSLLLLLSHAGSVFAGQPVRERWSWLPGLGLDASFHIDGLAFFFALLILVIGLLIILYARFYLVREDPVGLFYLYLLLFQGSMVGIVLSDNVLLLLVFWELTSLTSFLLIGYWRHLPEGRQGARMALAVTGTGGLAMIAGMLILGEIAGSYDLSVILESGDAIRASPLYLPALLLILGGAFTKSAQFPFHFWLPHAMAAPTPVSAYLHSATMVKAGVFLLARMWPALSGTPEWFYLVTTAGLVTMLVAAWIALFKDDLKALLAFSTVSHLGMMTMLLGFGTELAVVAAVFHILNHATFKAGLFMVAGIVDHETGTRDAQLLGGLARLMPVTSTLAIIAGASMAGLPPFNGIISKEMMLEQAVVTAYFGTDWLLPLLVGIAALLSAAYSARFVFHVFLGPVREVYPKSPHEPPAGMQMPVFLLVVLVVLIGIFPMTIAGPLVAVTAAAVIGGPAPPFALALWHGFNLPLAMSIVAITGGLLALWRYVDLVALRQRFFRPEAKAIFDGAVERTVAAAAFAVGALHTGSLPRYLAAIVSAAIAVGAAAAMDGGFGPGTKVTMPANALAVVVWVLLLLAVAGMVFFHRQRLLSLILMSIVGLVVSLAFLYFSAPDLALTQISVEVVTVVLLLLALNYLPRETPREPVPARHMRDGVLSVGAGLGVAFLAYAVMTRDFASISDWHVAESKPGGGGTNVVNVILVDFRGFDTYGEIIVLGIAALAIFALLDSAFRGASARRLEEWQPQERVAKDRHPLILVTATRVLLPMALLVGTYIFLRGHNEPGGGFIAGLVVSIALVIQYMASGYAWAQERVKVDYHLVMGLGILIAGLTGIGAWVAGYPLLTSGFTYVTLPVVGTFELATAIAFDLGVSLTVIGSVMLALANLSRVGRLAEHAGPATAPADNLPEPSTPAGS